MFSRSAQKVKVHFDSKTLYEGHLKVTYRGVPAIKCPFDYLIYQMLIWELKPDLIIEIGTNKGGSALYLADILNTIGHGEIHSIDISKAPVAELVSSHPRIKLFTEGYEGYDTDLVKDKKTVLVIEDGSHTFKDSLAAMQKFASLVTPGSYLIVEDGIINELGMKDQYQGGPLKAIDTFLETHPEFEIDRRWCDWFGRNATFNVNGFLRRLTA